ncbi:MAG: UDP-N-acetylglucosamine 2-epimerase (non-hydrolyzing) [Parachlamydia sp.]|nr:UDP-N-acetylglucosamine 2-epimerase (non-hydrolyzing) [Parachlamydia sp.]
MKTLLTIIGTRPEAIKLAPVLSAMQKSQHLGSKVCVTRQHTELLDPLLDKLGIQPDFHFEKRSDAGSLHHSAAHILHQFEDVLKQSKPDLVVVQGDTTSAFIAALAAFYACIPVAHVEAGLRTGELCSPWPEEGHRHLIDRLSTYCFAPTHQAKEKLMAEGTPESRIWVVGNTATDALRVLRGEATEIDRQHMVLITVHRRENLGTPLQAICQAMRILAAEYPSVRFLFFLHPNPAVRQPVIELLAGIPNLELTEPVDHPTFIQLLDASLFVITDSGGIQEEAPFLGKPVVILRNSTERPEGITAGTARLVGSHPETIIACCKELLDHPEILTAMSKVHYPYGDGYAAERIVSILESELA